MCRELEVNGSTVPVFHTDNFILKVTVAKVTEKLPENRLEINKGGCQLKHPPYFIHLPQSRSQNQSRHHPRSIRE